MNVYNGDGRREITRSKGVRHGYYRSKHPNIVTIDVINHHQHIENDHFKGVGRRGRGTDTWKVILPFKVSL